MREGHLTYYFDIVEGKRVPRFVLASRIPVDEISWKAHEEASKHFREELERTELLKDRVLSMEKPELSYLDLKYYLADKLTETCELCERRCKINRKERIGVCRVPYKPAVASAFLHYGEETPLVPSGTIFFYGCNFRCVYCQNYDISWGWEEIPDYAFMSIKELAALADYLIYKGAININRVGGEPTPYLHAIIGAMRYMRYMKPQIWNSNMYLTPEALKLIGDIIDLRLPDFKYGNDKCALKYSAVLNYWEITTRNLKMAYSYGADGIIRHLVLPDHLECCTYRILDRIADNVPERYVNVMGQYYPTFLVPKKYPELNRRLRLEELYGALKHAQSLGLKIID